MAQIAIQNYVQKLYQSVLMREGETLGISGWTDRALKGLTSIDLVQSFIVSAEAQNIIAVLRLYDVFFDRAADRGGLSSWAKLVHSGSSIYDVALAFSLSGEYQAKHANSPTSEFVETLYGNLFERGSDRLGKAYWIGVIDSGKMSRAEVALAFTLSDEAVAADSASTRFAESYLALRSTGSHEPSTATAESLAKKSLLEAIANVQTIQGIVQNGIMQNASVFRDGNDDGLPDIGATVVTTDAKGKFTLIGGYGDIVVTGGQDLTTGKTNDKLLSTTMANAGANVMVTPLTAIIHAIVNQGINSADAVKKVNMAFGLDAGIDLLSFNHTNMLVGTGVTAAEQKNAVAVKGAVAQITMLMENAAGLIKGVVGSGTNLDLTTITASVAKSVGDKIMSATAHVVTPQSTALVPLESQDLIKEVIIRTAIKLSTAGPMPLTATEVSKITNFSSDAAAIISALATMVKTTVDATNGTSPLYAGRMVDAFSVIAKIEGLAQDNVQMAVMSGAEGGSLSSAGSSYTGAQLGAAVRLSVIGPLTDDVASTSGGSLIDYVIGAVPNPNAGDGTGGGEAPGPEFVVHESAGKVTFGGNATGEITVAFNGTVATFTRQNVAASVRPDFGVTARTIELVASQALSLSKASLDKIPGDSGKYIDAKDTSAIRLTEATSVALSNDIAKLRAVDVMKISVTGADGQHLVISKADLDQIGSLTADAADHISLTNATIASLAVDQTKAHVSGGGVFTYSLAVGQGALGVQDYANIAALVAIVEGASNFAASDVTVTINGNTATVANIKTLSDLGVSLSSIGYSLSDTVANLLPSGVAANVITGNVDVSVIDAATVAQIDLIDAANGTGTLVYTLNDTLANLVAAAAGVLTTATSYSLSNASGALGAITIAQAAVVAHAADKADYSYSLSDTVANLLPSGIAANVITGNVNVVVTDAVTVAQISLIDTANGTGTLTFTLNDTLANLAAAGAGVLAGASSYNLSNANGLLPDISVAQAIVLNGAADKANYTYSLSDTVANMSAADSAIRTGGTSYTVSDTVANLLPSGSASGLISGNVNVSVTDGVTVAHIGLIDAANGTGTLTYTLSDDAFNIDAASTAVLNSATAIFTTAKSTDDIIDWNRTGAVTVRINIDLASGNDTFKGGSGEDYIKGNTGADIIDGGPGRDFYLYSDGTVDSAVTSGALPAAGFDTVTVSTTDAFYIAHFTNFYKVSGAIDPADATGDGLLAALNNAFSSVTKGVKDVMFVQFQNGDQYLVVNDGLGGGVTIDAADTVVKLIGAYSPVFGTSELILGS